MLHTQFDRHHFDRAAKLQCGLAYQRMAYVSVRNTSVLRVIHSQSGATVCRLWNIGRLSSQSDRLGRRTCKQTGVGAGSAQRNADKGIWHVSILEIIGRN